MAQYAQMVKGQLWVHVDGHTFLYETADEKKFGRKGAGKAKTNEIMAPMPGKITKILKREGASVEPGDVVLVMEAMKMEYSLKSEISAQVGHVFCEVGEQVVLGKMLVKLEPTEAQS